MRRINMRELSAVALMTAIALWTIPARAELSAQQKLLSCRAAQADAYRQLAESVKGLRIESDSYVRDFVAESDEIAAALETFIKGARLVDRRELSDGTCEVDVEVTIEQVQEELRRIVKERYTGIGWHEHTFDKMHNYYDKKVLVTTGYGVPSDPDTRNGSSSKAIGPSEPEWTTRFIRATGSGVPPANVTDTEQARLLADRAAEIDARRNLLEKIHGIQVDSATYVRDFAAHHDEVSTRLNAFLPRAKRVDTRYLESGLVEIDVEAPLIGVWDIVKNYTIN